mmetsp:Transcript_1892/g.2609  ORF Transcript_1892/g.2609 Transcript_1892/m.2609 type:complete len:310 (-) Transcript_1892:1469-2398(-)
MRVRGAQILTPFPKQLTYFVSRLTSFPYSFSMAAAYFLATTDLLVLRVEVSSPPLTEKSTGRIVNRWILEAPFGQTWGFLFVPSIAFQIRSVNSLLSIACSIVSTPSTIFAKVSSLLVPGSSPVAPTTLSVTSATLKGFLSPTIMIFATAGCRSLTFPSTGTGATFSPPAPMISSLYRPVILIMPRVSIQPLSPEWSQPSSSIADSFFFFVHSCPPSSLKSGFARYPIMICRPRKQISPCSSSVALNISLARGHSSYFPSLASRRIFTSHPGAANPHDPHSCTSSSEMVVAPVHSDIPYTSLTRMPSDP